MQEKRLSYDRLHIYALVYFWIACIIGAAIAFEWDAYRNHILRSSRDIGAEYAAILMIAPLVLIAALAVIGEETYKEAKAEKERAAIKALRYVPPIMPEPTPPPFPSCRARIY